MTKLIKECAEKIYDFYLKEIATETKTMYFKNIEEISKDFEDALKEIADRKNP